MALGVGVAVMVAASIWAPAQPELVNSGGACNVAMCGTLEDPQRWRAAWFIWVAGALVTLVATLSRARAPQGSAWRQVGLAALVVVCLPVSAVVGVVVSLMSSVQGFATVMVVCVIAPLVALGAAALRALSVRWRSTSATARDRVAPS